MLAPFIEDMSVMNNLTKARGGMAEVKEISVKSSLGNVYSKLTKASHFISVIFFNLVSKVLLI